MQEMADKLTGASAIMRRAIEDIAAARAMRDEVWDTLLVQEAVQSVDEDAGMDADIDLNVAEAAAALEIARCVESDVHVAQNLGKERYYMLEAVQCFQQEHERLIVDKELQNAGVGAYTL
jgi:hypothetical protein